MSPGQAWERGGCCGSEVLTRVVDLQNARHLGFWSFQDVFDEDLCNVRVQSFPAAAPLAGPLGHSTSTIGRCR